MHLSEGRYAEVERSALLDHTQPNDVHQRVAPPAIGLGSGVADNAFLLPVVDDPGTDGIGQAIALSVEHLGGLRATTAFPEIVVHCHQCFVAPEKYHLKSLHKCKKKEATSSASHYVIFHIMANRTSIREIEKHLWDAIDRVLEQAEELAEEIQSAEDS